MVGAMTDNETAMNFVMGTLSPAERESVKRERLYNRALDDEIAALEHMYAALPTSGNAPAAMPDIWSRIHGSIVEEARALSGMTLENFVDGEWRPHDTPKIDVKQLWDENTILIRCEPGGIEPPHDQPVDQDEHILVIAGELHMGGRVFGTGDYLCVPAGTTHDRMESPTGCILFTQYR
jgi:hypothetical protein